MLSLKDPQIIVCSIGLEIHSRTLLTRRVVPDDLPSDSLKKVQQSEMGSNKIHGAMQTRHVILYQEGYEFFGRTTKIT
jgi:hypothetical protein